MGWIFESQETLTSVEWILRGIVSFVFTFSNESNGTAFHFPIKISGFHYRSHSRQYNSSPAFGRGTGLEGSMITTTVIIVLYVAATWLSLKWPLIKRYLDPPPITLVKMDLSNSITCLKQGSLSIIYSLSLEK